MTLVQERARNESPVRIAVSGYYGCGNTGDEAVLAGIVESFARRVGPDGTQFTVLSQDPGDTNRRHGLSAVHRMQAAEVRKAIIGSDLLISGGGSLLQDVTSLRSLLYYQWVIHRARQLGRPVMFYAQGIGPLRRAISRYLVKWAGNAAQQITVRDEESAALLKRIGVTKTPIEVTADPAFALKSAGKERASEILQEAGAPQGKRLIGVALRPWIRWSESAAYSSITNGLAEMADVHLVFFPMQPPGDVLMAHEIADQTSAATTVIQQPLTPAEAVAVAGEFDLLVGMRLHALIFGAMGGVPLVAISYDPKVSRLMAQVGQGESVLELMHLDAARVLDAAKKALELGAGRQNQLRANAQELGERALLNVDLAMAVVGRNK